MRTALTAFVWTASVVCVLLAGLIAVEFVFMATSLDPSELATGGIDTWSDAIEASGAFAGLVVMTILSLALWHSGRFKAVSLILTATEIGGVAWACALIYRDYM